MKKQDEAPETIGELEAAARTMEPHLTRTFGEGAEGRPRIGIVTGSGLGGLVEAMEVGAEVSFAEMPALHNAAVKGHPSKWVLGRLGGAAVHVVAGRRHYYEGVRADQVVFAVRLLARLGVRLVVLSNAAGGLSPQFRVGDLMLIQDLINLQWRNPLVGPNREELGPRFPDMSEPFSAVARGMIARAARAEGIALREGVYAAMMGPSYETAAEIAMLRRLGAHAVGMSTAPEVIAARHAGLHVAGISLITNNCLKTGAAADVETTHDEVLEAGRANQAKFNRLLTAAAPLLDKLAGSPAFEGG